MKIEREPKFNAGEGDRRYIIFAVIVGALALVAVFGWIVLVAVIPPIKGALTKEEWCVAAVSRESSLDCDACEIREMNLVGEYGEVGYDMGAYLITLYAYEYDEDTGLELFVSERWQACIYCKHNQLAGSHSGKYTEDEIYDLDIAKEEK